MCNNACCQCLICTVLLHLCYDLLFVCKQIGHQYRQRLPPPVNRVATMVDMVSVKATLSALRDCDHYTVCEQLLPRLQHCEDITRPM
jgi:hypothetical protein